jgi:hypothetical protein
MARHFWSAASANTRCVPEDVRIRLLELVSMKCGKTWHQEKAFKHLWHEQCDDIMTRYCEVVEMFYRRYTESPAGKAFEAACAKARRSQKSLPTFTAATLRNFEGQLGIDWGILEPATFFEPLFTVCDGDVLEHQVRPLFVMLTGS